MAIFPVNTVLQYFPTAHSLFLKFPPGIKNNGSEMSTVYPSQKKGEILQSTEKL